MVYGKVPPQARELEQVILGAILLEKGAFDIVSEFIRPECFYVEAHEIIFKAMQSMQNKSVPIDTLTLVNELKSQETLDIVGGAFFVVKLTNTVVSTANLEAHCRIVLQKFVQRELIRISGEIIGQAYEESSDAFELLDFAENSIYQISDIHFKTDYVHISSVTHKVVERVEFLENQEHSITGIPTGYPELNRITRGWQPTDFIILAARPSVGKTAYALNLAKNAAMDITKPTAVGFFSLEMSSEQLVTRLMSADSTINMSNLSSGKGVDKVRLNKSSDRLMACDILIDDSASLTLAQLRSKARRMVTKDNVGLIIIDYLQLMNADNNKGNREQEISTISRGCKKLAKELKVPIIALSQLSRAVETRGKGQKVPVLADLRESGAIEQDADMVMFIYRPPEEEVKEDAGLKGLGMTKIAKHRNGELESFSYKVMNNIQTWQELGVLSDGGAPITKASESTGSWKPITINNDEEDLPF